MILTVLAGSIAFLGGEIGLLMNILFPKFDWDNENVPVKQGGSVFLTILTSFVYTGILFLIIRFVSLALEGILLLCLLLTIVLAITIYLIIFYKGESLLLKKL